MVYGRVYAIRSHQTTDIYIGSTTQILCKRMSDHRGHYKRYLNNQMNYISSFELVKYEDSYIELIYEGEFESKESLQQKEGEYQRDMSCVNKRIEGRPQNYLHQENEEYRIEYKHTWYENNKETLKEKYKKYAETHKERRAETSKKWREENKEYKAEMDKKWREENKEHKSETNRNWRKTKYECECGSVLCIGDKSKHIKTKKHQLFLQKV